MSATTYEHMASQLDDQLGLKRQPDGVVLQKASSYEVRAIQWLWKEFLALGKLHLIAGAPGTGKTTLVMLMAAIVSARLRWPGGTRGEACDVLVYTAEDDPADTLIPRLMAMGADLERVHFIHATQVDGKRHPFDPSRDMTELEMAARTLARLGLIVIDPIVSAIARDGNSNNDVRRGLQPLVDMAQALNAAVIGITHLTKGTAGRDPTERVNGSIAYAALARVVMLAAKIKGDDGQDRRVLVRSKSNIGPDQGGFEYSLQQVEAKPGVMASIATWGAPIEGSARELLAVADTEDDAYDDAADAVDLLRDALTADSWTPHNVATQPLRDAGFTKKQIWAAGKKLGILRQKGTGGAHEGWYLRLPPGLAQGSTEVQDSQDSRHSGPESWNLGRNLGSSEAF